MQPTWRYLVIELLRTRRSIRKYEEKAVDGQTISLLRECLLRCPSSRGISPWVFIFVDEPALISDLSRAKEHGSGFLAGAPLAIVVCGDETKSDVWVEDCSIVTLIAHLSAHSLGLGSCWIQIRNRAHSKEITAEQYIQQLLHIPTHFRVVAMVSVGYPAEESASVPVERLPKARIMSNRYGALLPEA
jgi:nitroreductase